MHAFKAILIAVLIGGVIPCGGIGCASAPPPPPPALPSATVETAKLIIGVRAPSHDPGMSLGAAIQSKLVGAGYRVEVDPKATSDLVAKVEVRIVENKSFFQVTVNGQKKVDYTAHAFVTLQANGVTLERTPVIKFDPGAAATDDQVQQLVAAIAGSPMLVQQARLAGERRARAEEQARVNEENRQAADAEKARVAQEKSWVDSGSRGCKSPTTLNSCQGVQMYLVNYPNGSHGAEAKQILNDAQPKLDQLQKDDDYWTANSGAQTCKRSPSKQNCAGVELYMVKYSVGIHAAEAAELMDALKKDAEP